MLRSRLLCCRLQLRLAAGRYGALEVGPSEDDLQAPVGCEQRAALTTMYNTVPSLCSQFLMRPRCTKSHVHLVLQQLFQGAACIQFGNDVHMFSEP